MTYLVAAYSAFFLLVFFYLVRMGIRQRDIDRRIGDLRRNIDGDSRN